MTNETGNNGQLISLLLQPYLDNHKFGNVEAEISRLLKSRN